MSNEIIPTEFTISPGAQGDVYATEFVFETTLPQQFRNIKWDFGDGHVIYTGRKTTHRYNYPGIYTVRLSAWSVSERFAEDFGTLTVDYVYRDSITFTQLPRQTSMPGLSTSEPFVLSVVSAKINEPISIVLQSIDSRSVPNNFVAEEQWRKIIPRWRFLDGETKQVLKDNLLDINTVPLYKNGTQVGVSGTASFYYIDDTTTVTTQEGCPVYLVATLSTQNFLYPPESIRYPYHSYSNTDAVQIAAAWEINDCFPTELKVSQNFNEDVYSYKWANVPIPVMITCRFEPNTLSAFANIPGISATDVFGYPKSNAAGAAYELDLRLSSNKVLIPRDAYRVEEAPLYFKNRDEKNSNVAGYVFTTITPLSPINMVDATVVIAASTVITNYTRVPGTFDFPLGYPLVATAFVSNPYRHAINRIKINNSSYSSECQTGLYFREKGALIEGYIETTLVDILSTNSTINYEVSGAAAVYGIAFQPIKNVLYACDADSDVLYSFSEGVNLLTSVNISNFITPCADTNNVPSYITIDGENNVWVSLYDNQRLVKFDSNLNFLASAIPSVTISPLSSLDNTAIPEMLKSNGNFLIAPPVVEADRENNVWACFAHPLSSMVVKFDSTGSELFKSSSLPISSVPVSIAIDVDNNVWIACYNSNELIHLSGSNGALIKRVSDILRPSYIAVDRANNLWVCNGYNICSYVDSKTSAVSSWRFLDATIANKAPINRFTAGDIVRIENYSQTDRENILTENEIWSGLSVDVFGRIWLIDGMHNITIVFNPKVPKYSQIITLRPPPNKNYVIIAPNGETSTEVEAENVRSAQAAGDWTGNKWYQKYVNASETKSIKGQSAPFNIYDINEDFKIAKVNEEFNMAEYLKSLAVPEILKQNTKFFDEFLTAVVGDGNVYKESVGRIVYEKIANFIASHADIDTVTIQKLLDFADQVSVPAKTFTEKAPPEMQRLLDMFSVPKHKLRGVVDFEADPESNVGPLITVTDTITQGQKIFVRDKKYPDRYYLIAVDYLEDGTSSYPLSQLKVPGFAEPLEDNYLFFEYNENAIGYQDNVINWESENTNLNYSLSSWDAWYGKDGLVELCFNSLLTRKLFLE